MNDWIAAEWLDKEPRLRASIVVPMQNPELAVEEINRVAPDRRFVQILLLVMHDHPLGKRHYWPIYAAAEKHGLPVGIHAGSAYRHPVTPLGWPTYYTEDYAAQSQAFQAALSSPGLRGRVHQVPDLKVVLLESGFTWLPAHLWRLTKFWRGLRMEVPWVDRAPTEIVRSNVRLTTQPCDAPPTPEMFQRLMDHMGSDEMLLFSTDYPHWQFDGDAVLPEGLSRDLVRKIMIDNPRETYSRLTETVHERPRDLTSRRRTAQPAATSKLPIADGDIHPQRNAYKDLFPFMEQRWIEMAKTFGSRPRQAYQAGPAYPKGQPNASRRDAWPPDGGRPGCSLAFMQKQLLDENNIQLGVLDPTGDNGASFQNREFGAGRGQRHEPLVEAEWLIEPRLKGSIVVALRGCRRRRWRRSSAAPTIRASCRCSC